MSFTNIVTSIKWEELRKPGNTPKRRDTNPFDGNDAKARMACARTAVIPATPKGGPNRPSKM